MKTNRKPGRCLTRSDRVPSAVIALLMALLLTTSTALNSNGTQAQSKRKRPPRPRAQVKPVPSAPQLRDFEFETVTLNSKGAITARRKGHARYYTEVISGVPFAMVEVPAGSFMMGSTNPRDREEGPVHKVALPSFFMSKYEVTQAQWRVVARLPKVRHELNPDPSRGLKGDNLPVESVSWVSAMEFCARMFNATGRVYRLPSEAEWEYACGGGTTTPFAFGETITAEIVNYNGNSPYASAPKGVLRKHATPVGSLGVANGFGLYDMHGNVQEWSLDYYHDTYDGAPVDGSPWVGPGPEGHVTDGTDRMVRGGSWDSEAEGCRCASRRHQLIGVPDRDLGLRNEKLGFRVVANRLDWRQGLSNHHQLARPRVIPDQIRLIKDIIRK